MTCKTAPSCPCNSIVRRKKAVQTVCNKLSELLMQDAPLIEAVVARTVPIDAVGDEPLRAELDGLERRIAAQTNGSMTSASSPARAPMRIEQRLRPSSEQHSVERADLRLQQTRLSCRAWTVRLPQYAPTSPGDSFRPGASAGKCSRWEARTGCDLSCRGCLPDS